MKELKTLHFPNEAEPREIVDAYARQRIANLTTSGDAPVLDAVLGADGIMTYNNSPAFDEWLTETEGSERFAPLDFITHIQNISSDSDDSITSMLSSVMDSIRWGDSAKVRVNIQGFQVFFDVYRVTNLYGMAYEYSYDSTGQYDCRWILNNGTWIKEWVNPPMAVGVEYRTTERWQGKPVYTALVNCGAIPTSNTTKNISHGFTGITNVLRTLGTRTGVAGDTVPGWYSTPYATASVSDVQQVLLLGTTTGIFLTGLNTSSLSESVIAQMWYVK